MCSHPRGNTWGSKLSSTEPFAFKTYGLNQIDSIPDTDRINQDVQRTGTLELILQDSFTKLPVFPEENRPGQGIHGSMSYSVRLRWVRCRFVEGEVGLRDELT